MKAKQRKLLKEKNSKIEQEQLDKKSENQIFSNQKPAVSAINPGLPTDSENENMVSNPIIKRSSIITQLKAPIAANNQDSSTNINNNLFFKEKELKPTLSSKKNSNKYILSQKQENFDNFLESTNPNKPDIKERKEDLNKMIQILNLKISSDKFEIKENEKYKESKKEYEKLKKILINEEKNLNELLNNNKITTQSYIEKIIYLQNQLINSPQGDILSLKESNKLDEVQINNLIDTIYKNKEEFEIEKEEIKILINTQIEPIKNELIKEIEKIRNLKNELIHLKGKELPQEIKKKIQVVLKYKNGL
jgi:hypothetical protein